MARDDMLKEILRDFPNDPALQAAAQEAQQRQAGRAEAAQRMPAKPQAAGSAVAWLQVVLSMFGIVFGVYMWVFGARYTIDGAIASVVWPLRFLGVPVELPALTWEWYLALLPLPVLFSIIEWNAGAIRGRGADAILVWAVIIAADLVSTFVGLQSTPREALPPLLAWPTANIIGTALVTAFLTFYPEWQVRAAWRRLSRLLTPLRR